MYNISDKFRNAMRSNLIIPKLRGTINGETFTQDDILEGSFRVCNQCVDVSQISLGGVFVGELRLTFLPTVATSRGSWVGKTLTCEYGLEYEGEDVFIPCPSYLYYISEANWTAEGLEIVAYDSMSKLDLTYSEEISSGYAYDWLLYISTKCGIPLGMTQEEVEALPNGTAMFGLYTADNIQTYRDLLSFLASALGSFATCGRDGSLVVKRFGAEPVDTIDETKRFAGGSFSDYVTTYTGLQVVDIESEAVRYYHEDKDDGLVMKLGTNPFLQYGVEDIKNEMRLNVLHSLRTFKYVPYDITLLGCCAYDLGDVIRFTGGIAEDSIGCVMSYDFGMNDYSVAGYGDNPALQSALSKLDKEISGFYNQKNAETAKITSLTNIREIPVSEQWTKLGSLTFAAAKKQTIMFNGVSKLHLTRGGLVRFKYDLNGVDIDFIHEVVLDEGTDTATLFIPAVIDSSIPYTFTVSIQSDEAVGTVEPLDLRGALMGVGISEADWSGVIVLEDVFKAIPHKAHIVATLREDYIVTKVEMAKETLAETFGGVAHVSHIIANLTDDIRVITRAGIYDRRREDGITRTTEDGTTRKTYGGY